ncbi:hypothetical protein [Eudoraea sp.]|uniref:hypothetical protein n=1 Tax=Eudoraea sp. TaxID=1979955 RepID=UPI003C7511DA
MPRVRIVRVDWDDAFIETSDFGVKEAKRTKGVARSTVGFLVAKNQHGYVLATDKYTLKKDGEFAARMFIPKGMVTKVKNLT